MGDDSYSSRIPYADGPITALAVYCSDGRIGAHVDDFIGAGLDLARCDRMAIPGGPVQLARDEDPGPLEGVAFLAKAHAVEHIVLIAHESCAYYAQVLGLADDAIEPAQRADLRRAAGTVRETTGVERVSTYLARPDGSEMCFIPVGD